MLSPRPWQATPRLRGSVPPLALALILSLGACNGEDNPLAPADASPASGDELTAGEATSSTEAAVIATSQRIVFSSARKGGYDIFKMTPQGGSVAQLTSFGWYGSEPAWSYDNTRIALVRPRLDASKKERSNIYLISANGTNGKWATSTPFPYDLRFPNWSPNGTRLVMTIMQMGKPYIARLDVATGVVKFVTTGGTGIQGNYPAYNPSGTKIIYVSSGARSVYQLNPDGTSHTLVFAVTDGLISSPTFSPDGKKIAFAKLVGFNHDIYVKNLVDGSITRLTTDQAADLQPSWSPDGSRIAFTSSRSGKAQIYTMDPKGGNLKRITFTNTSEDDPSWSH